MAATVIVRTGNYFFDPTNLTINAGDTILWTNVSTIRHDATHTPSSGPSLFGRPQSDMAARGIFAFTFTNAGYYPYVCQQHIAIFRQQTGTVTVVGLNVPPSVSISNPVNNMVFAAPAAILIQAVASTAVGSVTNVSFFSNGTNVGADASSPFSTTFSNMTAGSYSLTTRATADTGLRSTSAPVNISVVTPVPIVLSSPRFTPEKTFRFNYTANPGLTYVVRRSTNGQLSPHIPFGTNVAASNLVTVTDTNAVSRSGVYTVIRPP